MDKKKIEKAIKDILVAIREDPSREGLIETPARVANMYEEIYGGIKKNPAEELKIFSEEEHDEIVLLKDIPLYSVCEHHMVPFHGKACIGYIPNGKIVGLSKLARLVEVYSKRLQLQERLTSQVADSLMNIMKPLGVMVIIDAEHLCMSMRGIKKPSHSTITSAVRGCFKDDKEVKNEFLSLVKYKG